MDFADVPVNFSKDFEVLRYEVLEIVVGSCLIAIFCFEEVRKLLQRIDRGAGFVTCSCSAPGLERNSGEFTCFSLSTGKKEEEIILEKKIISEESLFDLKSKIFKMTLKKVKAEETATVTTTNNSCKGNR